MNTLEIFDDDPVKLAKAIRENNPDIVIFSVSSQSRPILEKAYSLARDLFEPHTTSKVFVQPIF